MHHEGKYLYGIIATEEGPNFGSIGIGGKADEVVTIGTQGVAAVVSNSSMDHYTISPENLKAHARVIEKVAESYTILPMRFCTVAESTDEILAFLEDNKKELKNALKDMEGKAEIGIKVLWKEMKTIYDEITKENKKIRELKANGSQKGHKELIHAGELVEAALEEKKAVEGEQYLRPLKKVSIRWKEREGAEENTVLDAAFLVDRDWLKEFDARVETLGKEYDERIEIKYIGPMPPFSFTHLELHWNGRMA
jgi:hypothetical protein